MNGIARVAALLTGGAAFAVAQSPSPFAIFADQEQTTTALNSGSTLSLSSPAIGTAATARLTLNYRGSSSATVTAVDRTGSNDFSLSALSLPVVLNPNTPLAVTVRFTPSSGRAAAGRVSFTYTETNGTPAAVFINLAGTAPEMVVSYVPAGGNATPLEDGGSIAFPPTAVGTASTVAVAVTNRGTAAGVINSVTSTGTAFQLSGLPLPPTSVEPGRDLRFALTFTPPGRDPQSGTLRIALGGRALAFTVQGSGAGPVWSYQITNEGATASLAPNQTVVLRDTVLGERTAASIRVANEGNAEGVIASIAIQGAGFQLSELPFLPLTVPAGGSANFNVVFAPAQPGRLTARLRIGNDAFELAGSGLGAALAYSYSIGGTSTQIPADGSLQFSSVQVGSESEAVFEIANNGTRATAITSLFVTPAAVFRLEGTPNLPLALEPGAVTRFTIRFAPTTLGLATASLRVNSQNFALSGSGAAPPPLPAMVIEGPAGRQDPLQQPAYSVTLSDPYPLPLNGVLTLGFNSEVFTNDATVQFATGGRTVLFTIPANSTRAVFPNNAGQVRLQTGTVAGAITLAATVSTQSGIELRPPIQPSVTLNISRAAPELVNVQISNRASNSFVLLVTGYSTGRSVTQIELQVTPTPGENLPASRLILDVEPAFLSWYQNAQSQLFGSLFTAAIPVNIEGSATSATSLLNALQSVAVTLANSQGKSATKSAEFRSLGVN